MAFWGIEVKPGRPYTHLSDHMRGRLHLSQATLGTGSSTKKSIVQCNIGDKSPIFLCTLLPERIESCQLNLEFEEDDEVTFSVVGPHSIHLSGFFLSDGQDAVRNDYESDSYGEDIAETETEDSTDYNTEDEYDDDFIDDDDDDDLDMFPTSRVPNVGVVIEEILDDEKPANGNVSSKRLKMSNRLRESDDDNDNSQRKIVKSGTGVPVLESEDEDGFPISSSRKQKLDGPNTKAKAKEKTDKRIVEEAKKTAKDDFDRVTSFKRRFDTLLRDGKTERATGQPSDSSLPSTEVVPENNVKQKKKNKKKKKEQIKEGKAHETGNGSKSDTLTEDKIQPEEANTGDIDQDMLVTNEHDQKLTNEKSLDMDADRVADENRSEDKKKKKRKKKKKSNTQESEADGNVDQTVTDKNESAGEEKNEAKSSQVRTFPNGLVIEELAMGKPDGKRTSPGKKVSVHYIGKLKKNGKIFDSSIGRAPFKFRLGVGQVIKGWDVGVNGMRIGDKRRLIIPPAMGYGAQGAGEKIPPNSWLVFDIELVDVR